MARVAKIKELGACFAGILKKEIKFFLKKDYMKFEKI
jgi:hypothetical protein